MKSAVETIPNQTGWKQTFKFDRYGNRTFDTTNNNTTTLANGCPVAICNPTANPQDNKLVGTNYDSVGNTSQDANGQTFDYDAENKQVQVNNASGIVGIYAYDGDGKRIKKHVPSTGETTIFVYDADGKTVAEYSTIVANQANAKINYTTTDHLGSPRINTDANGNVIARHDTMPFGEEIQRANYGTDNLRNRFTSYERDGETGLDYAINRYHSSGLGRFTQVDPYNIVFEKEKGKNEKEKQHIFIVYISQPQIWNKYVYSVNNPLKFTDPDGRRPVTAAEQQNLATFRQSGYDYSLELLRSGEWTASQAEAFRHSVDAASKDIENAILAVPAGQTDSTDLRVVLYAIGKIGDLGYSTADNPNPGDNPNATEKHINSNGWSVSLPRTSNRCNLFVAAAYVLGANIGFKTADNPNGYQVNSASWGRGAFGIGTIGVSNDIASNGMANFSRTNSPTFGNIVVEPETGGGGHSGIVISGNIVVSGNVHAGIRTGSMERTEKTVYLRYKP